MAIIDRSIQPDFKLVKDVTIPKVESLKLNNSIPVHYINSNNSDIFEIIFSFSAGSWNQKKLLVAAMCRSMLIEGTKNHSSKEIANIFDNMAVSFSTMSGMHVTAVKIIALSKYMQTVIELCSEILKYPTFPESEFIIKQKNHKKSLIVLLEEEMPIAQNEIDKLMYGEKYPYGWAAVPEDYDKLSPTDLREFFEENYVAENLKIIVTANKKDEILDLLNKNLGDFRKGTPTKDKFLEIPIMPPKQTIIERPDALQSAIAIGWKLFPPLHEDNSDMKFLNTLFGGYFGSRLMQNIRQQKGYTYSIHSDTKLHKYDGALYILSEVEKENKFRVVDEIKNEVLKLQTENVSDEELNNVKNYLSGIILAGCDGSFKYSKIFHTILRIGYDFDQIKKIIDGINNISSERVKQLANKYLDIEKMYCTVVG